MVKVIRLLDVKYYTVKIHIVECNMEIKLKSSLFPDICLYEFFFFVLMRRTQSWSSTEYFTHSV